MSSVGRLAVSFQYRGSPVRLYSGGEAMSGLVREARRSEGARILLITQPSCVRAGLPERIRQEAGLDFALFSAVHNESPLPSVEAARDVALESHSELLVGVGGGSAIVTTRAEAPCHAPPCTGAPYEGGSTYAGGRRLPRPGTRSVRGAQAPPTRTRSIARTSVLRWAC